MSPTACYTGNTNETRAIDGYGSQPCKMPSLVGDGILTFKELTVEAPPATGR